MKNLYLSIAILTFTITSLSAQNDEGFSRQGKWLIETGLGSIGSFGGTTGASFLFPEEGGSLSSISFEGGKFITEDLAWTARISHLSSGGDFGLSTVGGGLKYYLNGNIPIKVGGAAGISSGFGNTTTDFIGNASIGYAANLADNILLEPNAGILYANGAAFTLGLTFALVF